MKENKSKTSTGHQHHENGEGACDLDELKVQGHLLTGWQLIRFAMPFTLSRLAVAVNVITNGSVIPHIGPDAASAGPLMISVAYAVIAPSRSFLSATGILVGKKYGEVLAHRAANEHGAAEKIQKEIGLLVKQSHFMGVLLAIPSATIFISMRPLLSVLGVEESITKALGDFLYGTAIGLLPMYWSSSDQMFALGAGHRYVPMIFGSMFPVISMGMGYPLAFGVGIIPKMDTLGLGIGMSLAAWVSFLSLRFYLYKNSNFQPYSLWRLTTKDFFKEFKELITLGLPLSGQAFSEWINLFILSTLVGLKGKDASLAANGSFQIITATNLIIAALSQATSVTLSKVLGEMNVVYSQNNMGLLGALNKNSKRVGYSGIAIGTGLTVVLSVVLICLANRLSSIFIGSATSVERYEDVLEAGTTILIINAAGLIADSLRILAASALGGSKDVVFAPLISLFTMTFFAIGIGALLTEQFNLNVNWLFLTRDIGIAFAAIAVFIKWYRKDHLKLITASIEKKHDEIERLASDYEINAVNEPHLESRTIANSCLNRLGLFKVTQTSELEKGLLSVNGNHYGTIDFEQAIS